MKYSRTREVILTLIAYNHPEPLTNAEIAEKLDMDYDMVSKYTRPLFKEHEIKDIDDEIKHKWILTTKGWVRLHTRKYTGIRVDKWRCKNCSKTFKELPEKCVVDNVFGRFCGNEDCSTPWRAEIVDFTTWKSMRSEFEAIYGMAPDEHKSKRRRRLEESQSIN